MARKQQNTNDSLAEIFFNLGRAKELAARDILEEQEKREKEKRRQLRGRFGIFANENDSDIDIDALSKEIEEEIALVKLGKRRKYIGTDGQSIPEPEEPKKEIGNSLGFDIVELTTAHTVVEEVVDVTTESNPSKTHTKKEPKPKKEPKIKSKNKEKSKVFKKKENQAISKDTEDYYTGNDYDIENMGEIELIGPSRKEDVRAHFATAYDPETRTGCYVYIIENNFGEQIVGKGKVEDARKADAVFAGATKVLRILQLSGATCATICTDGKIGALLKDNATYGLTGNYGQTATKYINTVKSLSDKCFLRLLVDFDTELSERAREEAERSIA